MLLHRAAPDESEVRDGLLDLRSRGFGDAVGVVEDVGHGARGDAGTARDVDELRTLVATGTSRALPAEDVGLAVAGARRGLRAGDVVGDQGGQPVHRVDGAVAVVLGRAADQFACVEFVQLPFDPYDIGAGVLRLQADDLAPAHAGVALEDHGDELVVTAGEQGGPFGGQQDAERVGHEAQPVKAAADIASAKVAARLSGKRVEALSERTETSTTWVNKDGSLTTELSAGPVRFERDGKWVGVDVELRESGDGVAPVAHPAGLRLAGRTGTPARSLEAAQEQKAVDLVTLGEGSEQITLQWKGGLPEPKLDGSRAEYVNAVPGADVVVEATRTGFEQFVEIKQRPEADGFSYTLPLQAKGLKVKQLADGSVLFTGKKNKKRAVMPAPVMWDSTVDKVSGEHTRRVPVKMKVVKKGSSVDLVVTPDAEFLADPATKYPVTVDPSTSALGNVFDTYVQQGETVDWSTDTELDLGNPGTTNADGTPRYARSFITWDTTPIQDALVQSAELSLYNFHSGNTDCAGASWTVWETGASSTSSRWTNQPTWIKQHATSTETKGRDACGGDGWINADVAGLVQVWASAKKTRGHMGLRTPSASAGQWKQVNSANAVSNPPKLVVNYNYRPKTGTAQQAGPPYFLADGVWSVNSVTPTLQDTFVDTDGDKVNGTFEIRDAGTDTQVGSYLVSKYVPSGQPASVTVPAGVLTDGKTYKFRTSPYDGAHFNTGWSPWATFAVDATAPSAPADVTSTDYPTGKWVKGAGQAGTFTVTPPSGTDHRWFEWSLDDVEWTKKDANGSDPVAIGVTPDSDGTHTLQVRSVDAAGNTSEASEYTFHVGPGGFDSPQDGDRTARRLSLVAEADAAKYDAASFSWRRSDEDDWTPVPVSAVTVGGDALSAWPVPLTNGKNEAVVWKATDTVDPDGTIQIKADFTGPDDAAASTQPITAIVDRHADTASATDIGPGTLNLLTGDFKLSGTEESHFGLSLARSASSRRPAAGGTQEGQFPIFGPEWVSGVVAEAAEGGYTHLRKTSDTSLDVVLDDDTSVHFTAKANDADGWVPEPGAEALTLTGAFSGSFTLTDTNGVKSVFEKVAAAAETWQLASSGLTGVSNSTTGVVSEAVVVDGRTLARPKLLIASGGSIPNGTCAATPSTRGCRVLEFQYATSTTATNGDFGDYKGRVKSIRLWSTENGDTQATSRTIQSYVYDASGRLREAWNPQISPALKTAYGYDADGRVNRLTPPGTLPWTFSYGNAGGSTGGEGMLTTVTRPTLAQGSASQTNGQAVTSVVYDVPLSGDLAPYPMNATAVKKWGQLDAPTDATAIFPADSTPASHKGGELTADAYGRALVHYINASGAEVNFVDQAGGTTTTESDKHGNTVRQLSAGNHALALGTTAEQRARLAELGIGELSIAQRARLLSTTSYFNDKGTRLLEQFGPLRRIELTENFKDGSTVLMPAGTSVAAQPWTVNEYDEGRPTDGSASVRDQLTLAITGARVRGQYSIMSEKRHSETQYNWVKGLPIHQIEDSGGLDLITTTEYDTQGRVTAQVPPGGTGEDAASRVTTYWSGEGDGWCKGRPEWAGMPCWNGPAGDITGGGSNPAQAVDSALEYGFYGQALEKVDTSGDAVRATDMTYDGAGRLKTVSVTSQTGEPVSGTSYTYNADNGQISVIKSANGGTILQDHDALGRPISYTDADDGVTTTAYDSLDRPVKITDSVPSTVTYAYDHAAEPRGLPVSMTDSVAGKFSAVHDDDGNLVSQKMPGGITLTQTTDPGGAPTGRTYTRDDDAAVVFSDTVKRTVHDQVVVRASSTAGAQRYGYDGAGRLKTVQDTGADTVCVTRTYGLDKRANRTSLATARAEAGAECTTADATTVNHSYDSADRITDSGYDYDAFGRTTAMPDGSSLTYYVNDLVRQQTTGNKRQTWTLDAANRFRGWTTESRTTAGADWAQTGSKTNHYGGSSDSPRWITDHTASTVSRMVTGFEGGMAATTSATGEVILQLANVHGDVSVALPLDASQAPVVRSTDEYGNPRQADGTENGETGNTRYGYLGSYQRSSETPSGAVLMGVRLYSPGEGRFLSTDPVQGGSCSAYDYVCGDPLNSRDLSGTAKTKCTTVSRTYRMYEAGVKIGTISMQAEFCVRSGKIRSSRAWSSDDTAGFAAGMGYSVHFHGPARNIRTNNKHQWGASGMAQICVFKYIPICGFEERFAMTVTYKKIYPKRGGVSWHTSWGVRCTNRGCKLKFK